MGINSNSFYNKTFQIPGGFRLKLVVSSFFLFFSVVETVYGFINRRRSMSNVIKQEIQQSTFYSLATEFPRVTTLPRKILCLYWKTSTCTLGFETDQVYIHTWKVIENSQICAVRCYNLLQCEVMFDGRSSVDSRLIFFKVFHDFDVVGFLR